MAKTKVKARIVLSAVLALTGVAAISPARADALASWFNCTSKPAFQWCDGRANGSFDGLHSWDYSEGASPPGVFVCIQLYKPSTGTTIDGGCGWDWTGNDYGTITCACYEAEVEHWSTGWNLNLNGYANTDW